MTSSTEGDAALEVAHALSRASEEAIGDLVAVILHGSLASGDFAARASDIDLLVVTRRPLADDVKSSLVNTVMSVARGAWLDYRVVASSAALRPALVPTLDLAVGIHPDAPHGWEIERGPTGEPDLLFEFAICRQEGRSLIGPEPRDVIGEVPEKWLLDLGDAYLKRWQEIDYDERIADLMVLTACRLWFRSVEHAQCTKTAAAEWVTSRAPDLCAPALAVSQRRGDASVRISRADVLTLLARVRAELAARR